MTGFSPRTPLGFIMGLFLSALLILWAPFTASGEFYKYVTDEGKTVFVDDIGKIPPQYRGELMRYGEKTDGLSPEEKATVRERDRRKEERLKEAETEEARLRREKALDRRMRTRVEIRNDRVMVPVTLGYGVLETRAVLVLDTGASMTTLYKNAVDRLYMRGIDRTFGRTADGNRIEVRLATLDHLIVGPHRMEKIRVGIVEPPGEHPVHDGLLGMDFLRGLIYEIDFAKQEIVWKGVSAD